MAIVAKVGDVETEVGSVPFPPAASGSWTAGQITYTSYPKLKIDGAEVIHEAKCTFTFNGATSSVPPVTVTGSSEVILTASATKLQQGSSYALKVGDSQQDGYLNTVKVTGSITNKNVQTS